MDRFDTESFIDEVEKRPALWDLQCDDNSNKLARNRAWQELVDIFRNDEDTFEKNCILGTILQKKWKNLRDCYIKEYKKGKTTPPSGARKGSQYVFFSRLSFLQKNADINETTNNMEEQQYENNERDNEFNNETKEVNANRTEAAEMRQLKIKQMNTPEDRITALIEKSIQSRESLRNELQGNRISKQDDDKLFCLSLYSELKKVPEDRRLETKIELLKVIQKGQSRSGV